MGQVLPSRIWSRHRGGYMIVRCVLAWFIVSILCRSLLRVVPCCSEDVTTAISLGRILLAAFDLAYYDLEWILQYGSSASRRIGQDFAAITCTLRSSICLLSEFFVDHCQVFKKLNRAFLKGNWTFLPLPLCCKMFNCKPCDQDFAIWVRRTSLCWSTNDRLYARSNSRQQIIIILWLVPAWVLSKLLISFIQIGLPRRSRWRLGCFTQLCVQLVIFCTDFCNMGGCCTSTVEPL